MRYYFNDVLKIQQIEYHEDIPDDVDLILSEETPAHTYSLVDMKKEFGQIIDNPRESVLSFRYRKKGGVIVETDIEAICRKTNKNDGLTEEEEISFFEADG